MNTDKQLLDELDRLGEGSWLCRRSDTRIHKKIRLHEFTKEAAIEWFNLKASPTVRGAIAAFLEAEENRPNQGDKV